MQKLVRKSDIFTSPMLTNISSMHVGNRSISNILALFKWESTQHFDKSMLPQMTSIWRQRPSLRHNVEQNIKLERLLPSTTNVLLLGDSHMEMYRAVIDR
jgi:hypothetical protein